MADCTVHNRRLVVVVAAGFLVCAQTNGLRADPILVSDLRFVSASVPGPWVSDTRAPDTPFAPFTATASMTRTCSDGSLVSSAFQTSTVTPTHFAGSGTLSASASGCGLFATANSALNIVFAIAQPYRYAFSGLLASQSGFAELVTGFGGEEGFGERGSLNRRGVLPAGQHEFIMEGYVEAPASARYTVDLTLAPVPEPGSMMLLGATLGGLGAARRLRRALIRARP